MAKSKRVRAVAAGRVIRVAFIGAATDFIVAHCGYTLNNAFMFGPIPELSKVANLCVPGRKKQEKRKVTENY